MPKIINVPTRATFDFTQPNKTIPLPRREAASLLRLGLQNQFTLTDPGAGAAGSIGGAAPAPLAPLGLINRLTVRKNPSGIQGELNFNSAQLALLQNIVIPLKRRVASRTPPTSGAAASYSVYAEMLIPYSLPGDEGASATPMAGADSWEVEVVGQGAAATARDAIYTGNTMTFTYHATNPISVDATVEFTDLFPGGALMEVGCLVDRCVIDSTDKSFEIKGVAPGEVPLLHVMQTWDNNARAVLPGAPNSFFEASYGSGEAYYSTRPAENVVESASRYGIRDGDMPTGAYFIDPVAVFGGVHKVPLVGASGGVPSLRFRLGSATTSPAWADILTVKGRWTKAGLDWLRAQGA